MRQRLFPAPNTRPKNTLNNQTFSANDANKKAKPSKSPPAIDPKRQPYLLMKRLKITTTSKHALKHYTFSVLYFIQYHQKYVFLARSKVTVLDLRVVSRAGIGTVTLRTHMQTGENTKLDVKRRDSAIEMTL